MFRFFSKKKLDQKTIEEIEEELILSDMGIDSTNEIISHIKKNKFNKDINIMEIKEIIAYTIKQHLIPYVKKLEINTKPFIILVFGTNGSGKTTSIGKMASYFQNIGYKKILLAAGDTFRSGATEQLKKWGVKLNLPIFSLDEAKTKDPASVIYQACNKAKNENFDILIADTSGRFSNNYNLMVELKKIENVLKKIDPSYPHESILVLDGTLGQSSLFIAEGFLKTIKINSLIITKLDGSSKGGSLLPITKKLSLPTIFLGIGEKIDDLIPFNLDFYIKKILDL